MKRALVLLAAVALVAAASVGGAGRLQPVPVLMYHVVADPPPGLKVPYPGLFVSSKDFVAEVEWVAKHGFHAVTLQRVFDSWRGAATLPPKPIVFSFDDGYLSQVKIAGPALRKHHWPGVLNLEVRNERYVWGIRPPGVRKLIGWGWEIDAHTINHPDLTTLDAARLKDEIAGSRAAIRKQFHVPVNFFCYPSGRYNATVIAAVQAAGFLGATTTNYGLAKATDLYTLNRVRVDGADGVRGLAGKLQALVGR